MEVQKKKREFEPLVPLGIFLALFGVIITFSAFIPKDRIDKIVDLLAGLAFLIWGGAWFYVGWRRRRKARSSLASKDEKS